MKIFLKWLGVPPMLTDQAGNELDMVDGARIIDLINILVSKNPALSESYLAGVTFMVNNVKADQDQILQNGDVVMILKTLGGGG